MIIITNITWIKMDNNKKENYKPEPWIIQIPVFIIH